MDNLYIFDCEVFACDFSRESRGSIDISGIREGRLNELDRIVYVIRSLTHPFSLSVEISGRVVEVLRKEQLGPRRRGRHDTGSQTDDDRP